MLSTIWSFTTMRRHHIPIVAGLCLKLPNAAGVVLSHRCELLLAEPLAIREARAPNMATIQLLCERRWFAMFYFLAQSRIHARDLKFRSRDVFVIWMELQWIPAIMGTFPATSRKFHNIAREMF